MGEEILGREVRMRWGAVMKLFVAVLLAMVLAPLAHAQRYQYVNPLNPRHNWVIEVEPAQFIASGRAVGAEFCAPATKFVCVKSENFNFAFPLNRAPEQKQWTLHGFTYELERRTELLILGQLLPVWMVESVQGVVTMRFTYSEERGILAMSGTLSDSSATFVSMKTSGFGAQPKPKVSAPKVPSSK
jgi:hypothetical protein